MKYNANRIRDIVERKKDKSICYVDIFSCFTKEYLDTIQSTCVIRSVDDFKSNDIGLGRKWRSKIKTLYPLIRFIKRMMNSKGVLFISQTSNYLVSIYSKTGVWDNIQYLIKCGVLIDLHTTSNRKIAKYYYVCKENLETYLKIYDELYGSTNLYDLNVDKTSGEIIEPLPYSQYTAISASINIDLNNYSFDDIENALTFQYSHIPYYQNLVEELNKKIDRDEEKIRFNFNFETQKGKVKKAGIRATNRMCNFPSIAKKIQLSQIDGSEYYIDPNVLYREQYLEQRFGEYDEYDIHASVPRVSHAMLYEGDMGDLSEDLYETLFGQFSEDYIKAFNPLLSGWCAEIRAFFKLMFMRLYFGGTPAQIRSAILHSEQLQNEKNPNDVSTPFADLKERGIDLESLIAKWQKAVDEYCVIFPRRKGDTIVFLHESCIYLEFRKMLADRGIDVVQVYDGFYFKKGTTPSDIDEMIKASARIYYDRFRNRLSSEEEQALALNQFLEWRKQKIKPKI